MKNNHYRTEHQRRTEARARLSRQSKAIRYGAINRYEMEEHAKGEDRATIGAAVSWGLIFALGSYAAYIYATL